MTEKLQIGNIECLCAKGQGNRIAYVLYPLDNLGTWLDDATRRYGMSILAVTGMDWDNDLTPWPKPGVPAGSDDFAGRAPAFLDTLRNRVIPACEEALGITTPDRNLVGVSLSGLFALWQWMLCDTFSNIAVMSGSFWYEGFPQWISQHCPVSKSGVCYMLLGKQEPYSPVPEFRAVGRNTQEIVSILSSRDIHVEFQWVPGNHYQHQIERLNLALYFLASAH